MPGQTRRGGTKTRLQLVGAGLAIGLATFSVVIFPVQVAQAATDTVTNCSGSVSVPGSLPYEVANAGLGDTIAFALSPACATITLASTIEILENLTISGPGAGALAVTGAGEVEVFDVGSVTASISGLTIEDGSDGGTGYGGGIFSNGTLTVTDCTVSDNNSSYDGGGIYNGGTLTVTNSTVSGNIAKAYGGGIFNANSATASVADSTLSDNAAGGYDSLSFGGGIYNGQGTLTVTDSTLSGNDVTSSDGYGGGIYSYGTTTVTDSTLSDDDATFVGGGIATFGGTVDVTNSTLSNDSAGDGGGGIYDFATVTVTSSTLSGNTVTTIAGGGGGFDNDGGTLEVGATIVANSSSGDDCDGSVTTDLGYNLDDDGSCGFLATSDLSDTPAGLDPSGLQDNGGPTQTIALEAGSAAIDHVSNGVLCPATDQRGAPRTVPCDIGAYDTDGHPAVVSEVSPDTGFTTGGGTVAITGSGFTGATAVDFGTTPATINATTGDTSLTVTAPPESEGTVDVTVTAPGGVSLVTPADQYTYTVDQTTPSTEPCSPTCTTNTVSTPFDQTSVSVSGSSGTTSPASTNLLVNTATLSCGTSKTHDYDYLTAVSDLTTTGSFATGQALTVTETVGDEPSAVGVKVCYAPGSDSKGTLLHRCKRSMTAPCLLSLTEQSGDMVVATFLSSANDPRFWTGDASLDLKSFAPTKGAPGSTVTIKGTNLTQKTAVIIGGVLAAVNAAKSTETKLVVTVASTAAVGPGLVTVTAASGEAVSTKRFTVT